ncbi:MAG: GAF domain-containing protein [Hymenobacter sp.]
MSLIDQRPPVVEGTGAGLGYRNRARSCAFASMPCWARVCTRWTDASARTPCFSQNPFGDGRAAHPVLRRRARCFTPEGQPLGTLCALDTVPRQLTQEQREALRVLARQVLGHLELRRARLQLDEERLKLEGVLRMANNTGEALYRVAEARFS